MLLRVTLHARLPAYIPGARYSNRTRTEAEKELDGIDRRDSGWPRREKCDGVRHTETLSRKHGLTARTSAAVKEMPVKEIPVKTSL